MTFVDLFVIVGARLESVAPCTSEKRSLGSPVAPHLREGLIIYSFVLQTLSTLY